MRLTVNVTIPSTEQEVDLTVDYIPYRRATMYQPEEGDEWEVVDGWPTYDLTAADIDAIERAVNLEARGW